jgi:nicotinate-nucleotide adenylyltransferase
MLEWPGNSLWGLLPSAQVIDQQAGVQATSGTSGHPRFPLAFTGFSAIIRSRRSERNTYQLPNGTRMKTGVLGGSFNPIHVGHLILASEIREIAQLDSVLFVPAYSPPHKTASDMVSGRHRLRMVDMAVADNPFFKASDVELRRGGVSYTIDTICELRRRHPDDDFYFIIGADSVPELATWHRIDELVGLCRFLTGTRPGHEPCWGALQRILPEATIGELQAGMVFTTPVGVSSSMIRGRIGQGRTIKYLVPKTVEEYIATHGLYRD